MLNLEVSFGHLTRRADSLEKTVWISLQSTGFSGVFSKSITSLALRFHIYSPTLTSIHDYLKNHRFD